MAEPQQPPPVQPVVSPTIVIFGLAFAVRAVFLLQSLESPYFGAPFLDEQYYYEWAKRIAGGRLISEHAFFRAPLYAYLLGALFAVAGPNFFLPKLLQHLLGSLAAVVVFQIADRCFDRRAAWIAGVLAALYPPLIFFEGELLDISLQCFFYPVLILIGLQSLRDSRWRWTVLFGIVAGAAAIARPNILLLIAGWLVLQLILRERWGGWRPALARSAAITGLLAAWMLPCLIHNVLADRSWVPISTYAGINFYLGNRSTADGYTASTPRRYEFFGDYQDSVELFARQTAQQITRQPMNAAAVQRYWIARTLQEVTTFFPNTVRLLWKKLVLFWNGYEIRNNKDLYFALQFTPALDWIHRVWNFRVLAPLSLLGILLAVVWRRTSETTWLALGVAAHMISVVIFFVCDRYRLPVAPMLIVFAAGAIGMVWKWREEKRIIELGVAAGALALLAVLVNVRWFDMSPAVPHKDLWNVANCLKAKGRLDEAEHWYLQFLEANPGFSDGWNNLGELYVRQRRYERALPCFERAAKLDARLSMPLNNLGYCLLKLNRLADALAAYEAALAVNPDNRLARNGRAEALAALQRFDEALGECDALLSQDADFLPALWTKAAVLARIGKTGVARDLAQRALQLAPPSAAEEIRNDPALRAVLE
ncbi:MAG: tetratricopeptide repeat protein [Candidatus Sumerlaeia bacterium]|nr:tetratricopeptide repeat protein [Candidatus Sumerlaeia bacterium]